MNKEHHIEENLIKQLTELKYNYRPDIVDRKTLEQNFKAKFEALNRVHLIPSVIYTLRYKKNPIKQMFNLIYGILNFASAGITNSAHDRW